MSDEREALKPCPLCEGSASYHVNKEDCEPKWDVRCDACGLRLNGCGDVKEQAATAWNRRPQPAPDAGLVIPPGFVVVPKVTLSAELRNARMMVDYGNGDVRDEPDPLHEKAAAKIERLTKELAVEREIVAHLTLAVEQLNGRLVPAPPVEGDGWRPIESAPKDGTRLLAIVARFSDCVPAIAWFDTSREKWWSQDPEDFRDDDEWENYCAASQYEPTHWMPLPAPPAPGRK